MHCKAWRQLNSTDSWPGAGLPWLGFGSLGSQLSVVVLVVVFDALTLLRYPWTLWAAAGNARGGRGLRHLFTHQYEYFLYRLCEIYIFACLLVRQAHLHFSLYFLSFFFGFFPPLNNNKKKPRTEHKNEENEQRTEGRGGSEARRGSLMRWVRCNLI